MMLVGRGERRSQPRRWRSQSMILRVPPAGRAIISRCSSFRIILFLDAVEEKESECNANARACFGRDVFGLDQATGRSPWRLAARHARRRQTW